jgi:predicted carbohydrate-binding protein with CBM48
MAGRIISSVCLSALVAFGMASPFAQQPQLPAPRSPEIHADKTVTFRLSAPQAGEVTLNGSWDGAVNIRMTKDEGGVWSATVGPLGAQLWSYWYLVDGVKALDPGNAETQRDGARYASLLMNPGIVLANHTGCSCRPSSEARGLDASLPDVWDGYLHRRDAAENRQPFQFQSTRERD